MKWFFVFFSFFVTLVATFSLFSLSLSLSRLNSESLTCYCCVSFLIFVFIVIFLLSRSFFPFFASYFSILLLFLSIACYCLIVPCLSPVSLSFFFASFSLPLPGANLSFTIDCWLYLVLFVCLLCLFCCCFLFHARLFSPSLSSSSSSPPPSFSFLSVFVLTLLFFLSLSFIFYFFSTFSLFFCRLISTSVIGNLSSDSPKFVSCELLFLKRRRKFELLNFFLSLSFPPLYSSLSHLICSSALGSVWIVNFNITITHTIFHTQTQGNKLEL